MFGEYPVVANGAEIGTLHVSKDGLMTVFDARCRDPGELIRLSVYGDKEAYLGVMTPDGKGEVRLYKRFSRAALADFPETIRFAAPPGLQLTENKEVAKETAEIQCPNEVNTAEDDSTGAEEPETEQIRWRHGAGGALVGICADKRYLAVPIKAGVVPVGGDFTRELIADTEYAVFELKNGT